MLKNKLKILEQNTKTIVGYLQGFKSNPYLSQKASSSLMNIQKEYESQLGKISEENLSKPIVSKTINSLLDYQINDLNSSILSVIEEKKDVSSVDQDDVHNDFLMFLAKSKITLKLKDNFIHNNFENIWVDEEDEESWEIINKHLTDVVG